jgi:cytochrome oxidase Cu insertion factor (SCO1/SenC/PrrC family)
MTLPPDGGRVWVGVSRRVRMRGFLVAIVTLVYLLFGNSAMVSAQFSEAGVEKFRVAVEAPDFTLKQLGGGNISLKELKGKVILLNFFAPY